jgi:hypothetical protein
VLFSNFFVSKIEFRLQFLDSAKDYFSPGSKDIKITLGDVCGRAGLDALASILSRGRTTEHIHKILLGLHNHPSCAKIALRRTEGPVEGCIGFHCDKGAEDTVQIALNDDSEYDGGKMCFVTSSSSTTAPGAPSLQLNVPKRYAGTITSHGGRVLHAVTKLHSGIRYGLFVVDGGIGLGENSFYCPDAKTVTRICKKRNAERKGMLCGYPIPELLLPSL